MYGLPKIHKDGAPLRPIISAIGTYNYGVAKYLVNILKPLQADDIYMVKDTPEFVNKIAHLTPEVDKYMVSFDVESLFTNIPTEETIEIILNRAFPDDESIWFNGLKRHELKRLLEICTRESHFQFNNHFYDQIDGVAMGSPLGPFFANIFMADFENKHMPTLRTMGIIKWCRYVDDIFATLNSKKDADAILQHINQLHPNIRFTIEHEQNKQLPFLDVLISRSDTRYYTSIYRKKTFTGVYIHWTSLTSRRYKIGIPSS